MPRSRTGRQALLTTARYPSVRRALRLLRGLIGAAEEGGHECRKRSGSRQYNLAYAAMAFNSDDLPDAPAVDKGSCKLLGTTALVRGVSLYTSLLGLRVDGVANR